jgi:hypothetical protein
MSGLDPQAGHLRKESLAIKERKRISEMKNGSGQGGKDTPTMIAVIHLISVLKVWQFGHHHPTGIACCLRFSSRILI